MTKSNQHSCSDRAEQPEQGDVVGGDAKLQQSARQPTQWCFECFPQKELKIKFTSLFPAHSSKTSSSSPSSSGSGKRISRSFLAPLAGPNTPRASNSSISQAARG